MILANGCNITKSEKFKGVWILSVPTVYTYIHIYLLKCRLHLFDHKYYKICIIITIKKRFLGKFISERFQKLVSLKSSFSLLKHLAYWNQMHGVSNFPYFEFQIALISLKLPPVEEHLFLNISDINMQTCILASENHKTPFNSHK